MKTEMFEATLFVVPVGKGRPRFGKGRTFTDPKTVAAEADVRFQLAQIKDLPLFEEAVHLEAIAVFKRPKSVPKKRVFHTSRPDASNVLKLLEDACNGMLWRDDSQIVSAKIIKQYGERPMIQLKVRSAKADDLGLKSKAS
jgi:Holliday junction resolvase RusA-like endonuclease